MSTERDSQSDSEPVNEPDGLVALLQLLAQTGQEYATVRLGTVLDTVGRRSFGPMLLLAGLIVLAP